LWGRPDPEKIGSFWPDEGVHHVDGRDAGLDEVLRVFPYDRVDRGPVDVAVDTGDRVRAAVDGEPQPVEDAAHHIDRDGEPERLAQETDLRAGDGQSARALEDLDDRHVAPELEDPAVQLGAVRGGNLHHFLIADILNPFDEDQRTFYLL
jgi:hypothetical protein